MPSQNGAEEELSEDEDEEIYQGCLNIRGERHGRGTLYFNANKTEKYQGHFKNGFKHGKGSFYFGDGSSLSGMFIDDYLVGKGLYLYEDGSLMVGTYQNGELHGPAEDYDTEGRLTFKGEYTHNIRSGICHYSFQYGGRLFGLVDKYGKFSGKEFVYVYPDEQTFLKGRFEEGDMVAAVEAVYNGIGEKDNPHSYKKLKGGFQYFKDVSTNKLISTHPQQADCYEKKRVTARKSLIDDANEGLFSLIHAAPDEVMSFYNGIRITHSEVDSRDWLFNDNTISLDEKIVVDVPHMWCNISTYCASLGHKANHSFEPNCKYDRFNHPRFGPIKCIRTIKSVSPGDELTVAYGYDHSKLETDCPDWYRRKLQIHLEKSAAKKGL